MNTYNYLPPERVSFLADGLLRFSQPDALNDPFECIPVLSIEETRQVFEAYIAETEASILYDFINEGGRRRAKWEDFQERKLEPQKEPNSNPGKLRDFFFQQGKQRINASLGVLGLSKETE
ncbi:MAG TPA: hypothetical protein VFQ91_25740 [Bryobacteraceae bacterium]|nr:hypothetical protein [Bryobacteraceae bacterium]